MCQHIFCLLHIGEERVCLRMESLCDSKCGMQGWMGKICAHSGTWCLLNGGKGQALAHTNN